ncbi:hypothetical protein PILCRDRAFT_8943 [Piloderma croceum F 1598]|uniref:Phospholipid/glycerol acyltransferase domain-containing protein n=1 Tax=Piloderma croceum (strain F 1598) TaxID=765440 RepID=A0A0C3FQ15_PILCF|nr:hypothetical protein PILCRDRAFT_8943 [Piloderma croceum F 1598]
MPPFSTSVRPKFSCKAPLYLPIRGGILCEGLELLAGTPNVPKDAPLILPSTHHNEIIDIAVLAITIPHRRPISFWTKSSLFEFPLAGAVLSLSGAIPVTRSSQHPTTKSTTPSLFKTMSLALHRGEVIGVFPEGTSYRSRVLVRYGSPIHIPSNQTQDAEIDQAQVINLTLQLESQLVSMSINAPDWLVSLLEASPFPQFKLRHVVVLPFTPYFVLFASLPQPS